jgi:hypothetical protein
VSTSEPAAREVRSLIAEEPARGDDKPDLGGWMQRLCRAATRELSASGVAMSVMSPEGAVTVLAASSPHNEVIEQLQFTLGEGPCLDAYALGRPVLTSDLAGAGTRQWPGYASAAQEHGVRAVFAFPLLIGGARLGAMDVYREQAGSLSGPSVRQALAFAEAAMTALLDSPHPGSGGGGAGGAGGDGDTALEAALEGGSLVVYQAQGMVTVQLGVGLGEAMVRMRAYAFVHDRPLTEVAEDVVARRVVFEPDR